MDSNLDFIFESKNQSVHTNDDSLVPRSPLDYKVVADNSLPVTSSSRDAGWWFCNLHNPTAMIGVGVLGLPSAMIYLGWGPGVIALALSWIITLFTLWEMIQMHEMIPGRRLNRYHELGQAAFGETLGLWIVVPQQIIVGLAVNIIYLITAGQSLTQLYRHLRCPSTATNFKISCGNSGSPYRDYTLMFAIFQIAAAQFPKLTLVWGYCLSAAVFSLSYSSIAWTDIVIRGLQREDPDYGLPPNKSTETLIFGAINSLGIIAFAYSGHNTVLEVQATLPSPLYKLSKVPIWQAAVTAYINVSLCYFPVALLGYWAFGNTIEGHNILLLLDKPKWLIMMANLFVFGHAYGGYQMCAMPIFDMFDMVLVKTFHLPSSIILRLVTRTFYVVLTAFFACTIPSFYNLLGFLGGFAFAPTTYFLPCIFWLKIYKPKQYGLSWTANWICIILGVALSLASFVGGIRSIIYTFYWRDL